MLTNHAFKWAALTLAASTFLAGCGGGGSGAASTPKSDGAPADAGAVSASGLATPAAAQPQSASVADLAPVDGLGYAFGSRRVGYVAGIQPKSSSTADQDATIKAQYDQWRARGVEARCGGYVVRFKDQYAEVSEGAGYGMTLAVLMAGHDRGARDLFDGLLRVVRSHPAYGNGQPALMDWRINADCSSGGEGYNAMDGDLDIAMALLMADKQWGSSSGVNYRAEALATIAALKAANMDPSGATKGLPNAANNRTSDYMTGHFKAFKRATGDGFWDMATDRAFSLMSTLQASYAPNTGLIPDFVINTANNPAPSTGYIGDGNAFEGFYFWNANRLPWRLASDYVTSGDGRSQSVTAKMMDFFVRDTGGKLQNIREGYKLDGSGVVDENLNWNPGSFVGPAMAGATVNPRFQPSLDSTWTYLAANPATAYYDSEIQLMSMIVATGNWWTP